MNEQDRHGETMKSGRSRREWWMPLLLCAAATMALFAYDLRVVPPPHPDMERYLFIAWSIRSGVLKDAINYHYPPFFPLLIAAAGVFMDNLVSASRMISMLSTALLVFPVFFLARRLFGRGPAFFAGLLLATRLITQNVETKAEQPAMLLIYAAILAGLTALENKKPSRFLITGLLFGAAFLTKPEASAYFLVYLVIAGIVVIRGWRRDAGLKTGRGLRGLARPLALPLLLLCAGYFIISGPYLYSYYRDTGMVSLNPKGRTLFIIHNYLYIENNLYKIQQDDFGYFTQAQRIYNEGDKRPIEISVSSVILKHPLLFVGAYARRFLYSTWENLLAWYAQGIIPWGWPLLLVFGLWPPRDRGRWKRQLYLHAFALIPLFSVPVFSSFFPRFYYSMVPWFMIVLGAGTWRLIRTGSRRFGEGREPKARRALAWAAAAALVISAVVTVACAHPDERYWEGVRYRAKVAEVLQSRLPDGCRYMAELDDPSIWSLAGFAPSRQELIPAASLEGVVFLAINRHCRFLVFHRTFFQDRYAALLPILEPGYRSPWLEPVFRGSGPGGDVYVIYEITPATCQAPGQ